MINLLGTKEKGKKTFKQVAQKEDSANQIPKKEVPETKKVNIKKYRDQDGISLGKLQIGLWFIKSKKKFLFLFIAFLILISALTWSRFLWTFGKYVAVDMRNDKQLSADLVGDASTFHNAVMMQAAQAPVITKNENIKGSDGKYDFYLKILNPNPKHWGQLDYYFLDTDRIVGRGSLFILPNEEKYMLKLGLDIEGKIQNVKFQFENIAWNRITAREISDWEEFKSNRFNFTISDTNFIPASQTLLTEKLSLNQLFFSAKNNSAYNYYIVNFNIILSGHGRIVGINKIAAERIYSGETKELNLTWPGRLGSVSNIDIIPELNYIDPDSYLKFDAGPGEEK